MAYAQRSSTPGQVEELALPGLIFFLSGHLFQMANRQKNERIPLILARSELRERFPPLIWI